jgi:hypothetical protein
MLNPIDKLLDKDNKTTVKWNTIAKLKKKERVIIVECG